MNRTKTLLLACLPCLALSTSYALTPTPTTALVPVKADSEAVVIAFKPCVSPVGLTRELPLIDPAPPMDASGKLFVLGETEAIRDGYRHSLYVSKDGKIAYIIQVGGIAGTSKVFGPFDAKAGCPEEKQKSEYS